MPGTEQRGRRRRLPAVVLAALLVLAGALALGVALHAQQSPPRPPASAAAPTPATGATAVPAPPAAVDPGGQQQPTARGLVLPAAAPTPRAGAARPRPPPRGRPGDGGVRGPAGPGAEPRRPRGGPAAGAELPGRLVLRLPDPRRARPRGAARARGLRRVRAWRVLRPRRPAPR